MSTQDTPGQFAAVPEQSARLAVPASGAAASRTGGGTAPDTICSGRPHGLLQAEQPASGHLLGKFQPFSHSPR